MKRSAYTHFVHKNIQACGTCNTTMPTWDELCFKLNSNVSPSSQNIAYMHVVNIMHWVNNSTQHYYKPLVFQFFSHLLCSIAFHQPPPPLLLSPLQFYFYFYGEATPLTLASSPEPFIPKMLLSYVVLHVSHEIIEFRRYWNENCRCQKRLHLSSVGGGGRGSH